MTETENDLELLDETVEVEQPRRVLGGSIASFVVLVVVTVGLVVAGVWALSVLLGALQPVLTFLGGMAEDATP